MFGTVLTAKDERLLVVYQTNILKTNPCQWRGANCNFETNHSTADIVSSLTNRQHFESCQFNMRKFKPVKTSQETAFFLFVSGCGWWQVKQLRTAEIFMQKKRGISVMQGPRNSEFMQAYNHETT